MSKSPVFTNLIPIGSKYVENFLRKILCFSILIFLHLSILAAIANSQIKINAQFPTIATMEKAQIIVLVADNSIDQIKITGAGQGIDVKGNFYKEVNSFIADVNLEKGDNQFIILAFKENKYIGTEVANIKFITPIGTSTNPTPIVKPPNNQAINPGNSQTGNKKDLKILFDAKDSEIITDKSQYDLKVTPNSLPEDIDKYVVEVKNENSKGETSFYTQTVAVKTNTEGNKKTPVAQDIPIKVKENKNIVTVYAAKKDGEKNDEIKNQVVIKCFNCGEEGSNVNKLYTRAVLGFQQSGASSASNTQKPFLDFFFTAPIIRGNNSKFFPRLSMWGDIRFTSAPQQQTATNVALSAFSSTFLNTVTDGKVNDLVQSFEFLAGLDFKLYEPQEASNLFGLRQKSIVSFIASFGASNPLSSQQSAQIFQVPKLPGGADNPEFTKLFKEAEGKTNIAFVPSERDRFYRQYYGGFRLRTVYYDEENKPLNISPAIFDFVIGQNEAITESLSGYILRLDGFYPFPIKGADFIYLYGTAQLKLGKQQNKTPIPFILAPATSITIPNNDTAIVQINDSPFLRSNRDRYSIGLGVDIIKLYQRLTQPKPQEK